MIITTLPHSFSSLQTFPHSLPCSSSYSWLLFSLTSLNTQIYSATHSLRIHRSMRKRGLEIWKEPDDWGVCCETLSPKNAKLSPQSLTNVTAYI